MNGFVESLAALGGTPEFSQPLPVGQLNFPDWERIDKSFKGIFERRYYTNHGPLAQELEARLADFLGVRHALCMTNATIGLMIAAVALDLTGKVITPGFTFIATAQSLTWAGLEPVFCDVDPDTHQISAQCVAELLEPEVSAILGVHLWGDTCAIDELEALAERHGVTLYFDAAQAFGAQYLGRPVGNFGALEVFSFHATKVLNAMEGGCVSTNDDQLAARLRNIRSSYGSGPPVPIPYTGNGRFSEAQAAMALLALEDYPENSARNQDFVQRYRDGLQGVPGIRFPRSVDGVHGNRQYLVLEVTEDEFGLSRDRLGAILQAENILSRRYFKPGIQRCVPFADWYPQYREALPVTDRLSEAVMQLPSGQPATPRAISRICALIGEIQIHAAEIARELDSRVVA